MNKKWDQAQKEFVENNCHIFNDEKLAQELTNTFGREFTKNAVRKFRQRLGLKKEAHRSYFKMKINNGL